MAFRSVTLDGVAIVYVQLDEKLADAAKQFNDINLKLNSIDDLPSGAGPIQFQSDFGDTAALMLTVASPKEGEVQLATERASDSRGNRAHARGCPRRREDG